jgi:hypothetical protein
MFHKSCAFMVFAGMISVAASASEIPQVVTSEVFYESGQEENVVENKYDNFESVPVQQENVPVWPLAGSEADVEVVCNDSSCGNNIITNNAGWTGGPNISNGIQIPAGFDYECANNAEMPLMRREMMEDDGGSVLSVSRSPRKNCNKSSDSYAAFAQRAGFAAETSCNKTAEADTEVPVNEYVDEENSQPVQDQVRSWVVTNGQTLRQVLQSWCDKEGWDLVWTTSREYPIEASAVFKGRFVDVASALIRNFERATPIPYAKFYKGNRVIVVSTTEE